MLANLDPGYIEQWSVMHERESTSRLDAVAEVLLCSSGGHSRAVGIAYADAYPASGLGPLGQQLVQVRVLLVEEQPRIHQHVDAIYRVLEQLTPQGQRCVRAARIQTDQLRTNGLGKPRLAQGWPQVRYVLLDELGCTVGKRTVGHSSRARPALDRLRVHANLSGQVRVSPPGCDHGGA